MPVLVSVPVFRIRWLLLVPAAFVGLAVLLAPTPAHAWTEKGHEIINRLAVEGMPPETPEWQLVLPPDKWLMRTAGEVGRTR